MRMFTACPGHGRSRGEEGRLWGRPFSASPGLKLAVYEVPLCCAYEQKPGNTEQALTVAEQSLVPLEVVQL